MAGQLRDLGRDLPAEIRRRVEPGADGGPAGRQLDRPGTEAAPLAPGTSAPRPVAGREPPDRRFVGMALICCAISALRSARLRLIAAAIASPPGSLPSDIASFAFARESAGVSVSDRLRFLWFNLN
jgi:hypothetical protein